MNNAKNTAPNPAESTPDNTSRDTPVAPLPSEYSLSGYAFDLPEELIAQYPAAERQDSRLLLLDKQSGSVSFSSVTCLAEHLPPNCLLVANNSRVFPARLPATRESGGKAEFLMLTPLPHVSGEAQGNGWHQAAVHGLARPKKRLKPGSVLTVSPELEVIITRFGEFGQADALLRWQGENEDLPGLFLKYGKIPLPPYIRREAEHSDAERYQTQFSQPGREEGSVAAPTAGLHLSRELIAGLQAAGHEWQEVTLHVWYGTFSPVRTEDIRHHAMHREYYTISEQTAEAVNRALTEKRPILAIGTTSARTLEGAFQNAGELKAGSGVTDIFIYPGYRFNVVSGLFTNFHLPGSTLLMLVSALAGREHLLDAYRQAIAERMRFFSYGDAMLLV